MADKIEVEMDGGRCTEIGVAVDLNEDSMVSLEFTSDEDDRFEVLVTREEAMRIALALVEKAKAE